MSRKSGGRRGDPTPAGAADPARRVPLGAGPWILLALALALGAGLPAVVGSVLVMTLLTQAVISGLLATGVGFLARQNNAVSFGHAAYFGLSGYLFALLLKYGLVPAEAAVLIALAVPTVLAFVLGLVIVRVPGAAFSMLTLAVGQAIYEFVLKARHVTGGDEGFAINLPPALFGAAIRVFQDPHGMFTLSWTALALTVFGLHVLVRSPFGELTEAIRENEERARFIGFETVIPRSLVFALSALIAALAGVLLVIYNAYVSADMLHWSLSGTAIIMVIVGGQRLLWGPAFGAVIFFFLKNVAGDLTEHWQAIIGVILILVTVLLPTGLAGALSRGLWRLRGGVA